MSMEAMRCGGCGAIAGCGCRPGCVYLRIDELERENRRLRNTLLVERGDPAGAPKGWGKDADLGWPWVRILRSDSEGKPESWLWAEKLGTFEDKEWFPWMAGLVDLACHLDEHSPHEISEWTVRAKGPMEVMLLSSKKYDEENSDGRLQEENQGLSREEDSGDWGDGWDDLSLLQGDGQEALPETGSS